MTFCSSIRVAACFSTALTGLGCANSEEEPRRPTRAVQELMPTVAPAFDAQYLADQTQVKLAAAREISYEPLESFRAAAEEARARGVQSAQADRSGSAEAGGASAGVLPQSMNFWQRIALKAAMGGAKTAAPVGGEASGGPAQSPASAPSDASTEEDAVDDEDDGWEGDDDGWDEEEEGDVEKQETDDGE